MKTLIIEDEKAALRNLKAVMQEVNTDFEIVGEVDSIFDGVEWFRTHPMPELVFMDIHLADGSAFDICAQVDITCPIIFTTAYDEYALRAFKVNSVAYLLKPISRTDLQEAMHKLELLDGQVKEEKQPDLSAIIRSLKKEENYKTHFLMPVKGDKLLPVSVEAIQYFYISNGLVKAVDSEGKEFVLSQSLDELAEQLNPHDFFRANRQFIVSRKAVSDISLWFNGRLAINLKVPVPEKIIISKAKASELKDWF
jgi:DNA-binding LytR/AlgR family response regulator